MGSTKVRLIVLFSMVAMLLAFVAPAAMAEELDCHEANRFENRHDVDAVRCDGDIFVDENEFDFVDEDEFLFDEDDFFVDAFEVDVDTEEVADDSDLEGECFVTEIDWDEDGFISDSEVEVTCFVEEDEELI